MDDVHCFLTQLIGIASDSVLHMNTAPLVDDEDPGIEGRLSPNPPSSVFLLKVMVRKHLFVALRRKRYITFIFPIVLYAGLTALLFHAFENLHDRTGNVLEALICPVLVVYALTASLNIIVIEIVADKESKMKTIQNIYGLTSTVYWGSWLLYHGLMAVVALVVLIIIFRWVSDVLFNANLLLSCLILGGGLLQQFWLAAIISTMFNSVGGAGLFSGVMNLALVLIATLAQSFLSSRARWIWYVFELLPVVNTYSALSALFWLQHARVYDSNTHTWSAPGLSFQTLFDTQVCLSEEIPCAGVAIFSAGESLLMLWGSSVKSMPSSLGGLITCGVPNLARTNLCAFV